LGAHDHDHASHAHDHSGHGHSHGHHGHSHAPANFDRAFQIGVALNAGFVAIEAGFGIFANSVALLTDAAHNLSDVFGLLLAWGAAAAARRAPSKRFTYGWRKSSVLAALFNALILLFAVGAIAVEALNRFTTSESVDGVIVMIVAGIGIVINGSTALLFARGRKGDLNIRGAYLHMAADAAVSAGVVIAGLVIMQTGWAWVDPLTSMIVVVVIVAGTWGLLRDSVLMALDAVPPSIDPHAVEDALAGLPGVARVHDLHIWPMSTTEAALTAHLVVPSGEAGDAFLQSACAMLHDRFGIEHSTLQLERGDVGCALEGHSH
jgi:cobalt-zinc-cadmium efflux system protein